MCGSGERWSREQLAEFLACVSSFTDERSAMRGGIERAATVLDGEVAVLLRGGSVETSIGFGSALAPEGELVAASSASDCVLEGPWHWPLHRRRRCA